ncbi:MAG: element excision factor XisI family protein [Aggregatilineales bacterium]
MDRVVDLAAIVEREVAEYVWDEEESFAYFVKDEARRFYAALIIPVDNPRNAHPIVAAHLIDDGRVVIDTDLTDKQLYKRLLDAGVPREKMVLVYKGEPWPHLPIPPIS